MGWLKSGISARAVVVAFLAAVPAMADVSAMVQSVNPPEAPLGFKAVYQAAQQFDPSIRRAWQTYKAQSEEQNIGLAGLLPDFRVSASYQYEDSDNIYTDQDSNFFDPNLDRSGGQLIDHYWRAAIRQPLFNYSAYQRYRQGSAYADAAFVRYLAAKQDTLLRTSELYLRVLLASQQVYLTQQKLDALQQRLTSSERAYELELGSQLDVLQVRSNRDLARSDLLRARSDLSDAQTELSNLVGMMVTIPEEVVARSSQVTPELVEGSLADWLGRVNQNLAVQEVEARIRENRSGLLEAKGQYLPVVNLNLTYYDRQSEDSYRTRTDRVAAVEVTMPLFSGGRMLAEVRKARAELESTRAELDLIRMQKQQRIKLAYGRLQSTSERLRALVELRQSSEAFLQAAERQQSFDLADTVAVLEARTNLADAQLQFVDTLNELLMSDLNLRMETGFLNDARLEFYDQLFLSQNATLD